MLLFLYISHGSMSSPVTIDLCKLCKVVSRRSRVQAEHQTDSLFCLLGPLSRNSIIEHMSAETQTAQLTGNASP